MTLTAVNASPLLNGVAVIAGKQMSRLQDNVSGWGPNPCPFPYRRHFSPDNGQASSYGIHLTPFSRDRVAWSAALWTPLRPAYHCESHSQGEKGGQEAAKCNGGRPDCETWRGN